MIKQISFWIGIFIVVASHIYMLVYGMPMAQIVPHSIANILAAGMIIYGSMTLDNQKKK